MTTDMRKIFGALAVIAVFAAVMPGIVRADVTAYLFYGDGCPHCAKLEAYLEESAPKHSDVTVRRFEVFKDRENVALMQRAAAAIGAEAGGVPFLVIGDAAIVGFNETATPGVIERRIAECRKTQCPDTLAQVIGSDTGGASFAPEAPVIAEDDAVDVPVLGRIDARSYSLPILAVVLGTLDGFNPCAMWALIFLISLLIGMQDRRRLWILGSAFILASAFVYFLFMVAWLNLIVFLGFVAWVRIAIALVALGGGAYALWSAARERAATCSVGDEERKQKTLDRIQRSVREHTLILALAGIVALAFAVNLLELVCSAGFPVVFTHILAMNGLPVWQYYAYILLYIFFFMIDDLGVFILAMITLRVAGITTRYVQFSRILGGVIMVVIGALLILRPELLLFG